MKKKCVEYKYIPSLLLLFCVFISFVDNICFLLFGKVITGIMSPSISKLF